MLEMMKWNEENQERYTDVTSQYWIPWIWAFRGQEHSLPAFIITFI